MTSAPETADPGRAARVLPGRSGRLACRGGAAVTAGLAGLLVTLASWAQAPAAERLHIDVREAIVRVPAEVKDAFGKPSMGELLVTTFKPAGPGPFPLVVISHGRSSEKRASYTRQRFETAARFFVRKGFAVAVPLRLGYGELADAGDPESSVSCQSPRFEPAVAAAATQILAVARHLQAQPDIDPARVVLLGQSVGGISTVAATAMGLPGQVAAINFAGGHGGDPEKRPGDPCGGEHLRRLYREYGELTVKQAPQLPSLWIYTENDKYFGPRVSQRWVAAFAESGAALEARLLPAFGEDGHQLFGAGNDVWQPLVDEFLTRLGFGTPGRVALPEPNPALDVRDEQAVPAPSASAREAYRKFLAAPAPRAFAFNAEGRVGYAYGDAAPARALAFCQRYSAASCQLYAVNDTVVWSFKP